MKQQQCRSPIKSLSIMEGNGSDPDILFLKSGPADFCMIGILIVSQHKRKLSFIQWRSSKLS